MTKKIIGNSVNYGLQKEDIQFLIERYKYHYKTTPQQNYTDSEYQCVLHFKSFSDLISKNINNVNLFIEKDKTFDFDDDRMG